MSSFPKSNVLQAALIYLLGGDGACQRLRRRGRLLQPVHAAIHCGPGGQRAAAAQDAAADMRLRPAGARPIAAANKAFLRSGSGSVLSNTGSRTAFPNSCLSQYSRLKVLLQAGRRLATISASKARLGSAMANCFPCLFEDHLNSSTSHSEPAVICFRSFSILANRRKSAAYRNSCRVLVWLLRYEVRDV